MKKLPGYSAALALILIAGGNVRADFIDWSFDWNVSPSAISSAKFGRAGLWDLGASGMDFNSSGARLYGPSLQAFSGAPAATPDRYDVSYNLTYHVWDRRSHQAGAVTFHGTLFGTISSSDSNLTNTFSSWSEPLSLDGRLYEVSLTPPTYQFVYGIGIIPPPEGQGITAMVVEVPQHAPEPSGLVLGGIAASTVALIGARKMIKSVRVTCL
jgi:hypothetical protein